MPNWVKNIVSLDGSDEAIEKVFETIKGTEESEKEFIDFNNIIPMPDALKGTRSPAEVISEEEYKRREAEGKLKPDWGGLPLTQAMSDDLIAKHGTNNWYDWATMNWNTKWNASDQYRNGNTVTFNTAWSHPYRIIEKLSMMFPDIKFSIQYADEDIGSNCGEYTIQNGECLELSVFQDVSPESIEFAMDIQFGDDRSYITDCVRDIDDEFSVEECANREEKPWPKSMLKLFVDMTSDNDDLSEMPIVALQNLKNMAESMGETDKVITFGLAIEKISKNSVGE